MDDLSYLSKLIKIMFYNESEKLETSQNIQYWQEHPDEFVEKFLGIKLFQYQKIVIKILAKNSKERNK